MVKVGDKVWRVPVTFWVYQDDSPMPTGPRCYGPIKGTVVYVHPEGRYHTVEFDTAGGKIRECYKGVEE